jgi:hypothetical protein
MRPPPAELPRERSEHRTFGEEFSSSETKHRMSTKAGERLTIPPSVTKTLRHSCRRRDRIEIHPKAT